ncbi:putative bifunctional diguanylate cyclase/phosphodiesterase [Pararhodospirillum oryzae]|uniref:GGDEF domain-containing protein n=1 Tax=Pararhodospirillum oryzae TaxID=478448 RepID=A0A512H3J6_9PROT|nr:EAL domain-containing protein [Pararhodospirillum oryzae]GEO80036.1 GGDEF domain-containing protein [Pararhodospirillum oryzae]
MSDSVTPSTALTAASSSRPKENPSPPEDSPADPLLRLLDAVPDALVVVAGGQVVFASAVFCLMVDRAADALLGMSFLDLLVEEDRDVCAARFAEPGQAWEVIARLIDDERAVHLHGSTSTQGDGGPVTVVTVHPGPPSQGLLMDGAVRSVLDQVPFPVMVTSPAGVIEYTNPAFLHGLGYEAHEVLGRTPRFLKSGTMDEAIYERLWADLGAGRPWSGEVQNRRKDGSLVWERTTLTPLRDAGGVIIHYLAVHEDISQRKAAETRFWHQANHDALTGLPNRVLLRDRMTLALAHARRNGLRLAVLFIDLDRFKAINETHGPETGDTLLSLVAARLRDCLRDTDTLARVGGDEFVILMASDASSRHHALVARRILEALRKPFVPEKAGAGELLISGSIGITVYPDDAETVDGLVRNAETAMQGAKKAGRNTYQFHTPDMNRDIEAQITLESALRRAVRHMDLTLHYQPVVDSATLAVVGTEALVRWPLADGGFMPPARFIPIAEELGLMEEIGAWVLWSACTQGRIWQERVDEGFRLAVNLSWRQLRDPGFPDRVQEVLEGTRLSASVLELEVSEATLARDPVLIGHTLAALHERGVTLTIDNFGSGHGSMKTLRHHPFSVMKLDRQCVADMLTRHEDAVLVETATLMARRLGLRVVAEGVETEAQLEHLRNHYCDLIQGFLFGQPLPPDDLMAML